MLQRAHTQPVEEDEEMEIRLEDLTLDDEKFTDMLKTQYIGPDQSVEVEELKPVAYEMKTPDEPRDKLKAIVNPEKIKAFDASPELKKKVTAFSLRSKSTDIRESIRHQMMPNFDNSMVTNVHGPHDYDVTPEKVDHYIIASPEIKIERLIQDSEEDSDELRRIDEELAKHEQRNTIPIPPFLPPLKEHEPKYTLVVDLDETLIHFKETENYYLVRPGVASFLEELQTHYELILFTASVKDYADWIVDEIDKDRLFKHRLYRNHCKFQDMMYIKDLSYLGRDLTKTIIIDNLYESFMNQPDNGILIENWYDDMEDNELCVLQTFLKGLVEE